MEVQLISYLLAIYTNIQQYKIDSKDLHKRIFVYFTGESDFPPFFSQSGEAFLQNLYLLATAVMSTRACELQDAVHTKQLKGIRGQHFLNHQTMLAIPIP